ncbi:MAG: Gmad2 immunoglobulin-like domain-containing protein [Chloroflexota bacterium]
MIDRRPLAGLVLSLLLAACNLPLPQPATPTPAPGPSETLPPATLPDTPFATGPALPALPEETILILEPGPGSRLVGSVRVAGISDPSFEQHLAIRILLDDGSQVGFATTTIQADVGLRGPFEVEVPFTVSGERNGFIQVYMASPRDGGITHLSSVGVILAEAEPVELVPGGPHPEDIYITQPEHGATLSGGLAHVEGIGVASFEGTLVISIQNADGTTIAELPVIVAAPDYGLPGSFSADVPFAVGVSQPGRIVVRDISPAFGGDSHLASVEVTLAP